jgi:hypothetical protein
MAQMREGNDGGEAEHCDKRHRRAKRKPMSEQDEDGDDACGDSCQQRHDNHS